MRKLGIITRLSSISPTWMKSNGSRLCALLKTFDFDWTEPRDKYILECDLKAIGNLTAILDKCRSTGVRIIKYERNDVCHRRLICNIIMTEITTARDVYLLKSGLQHHSEYENGNILSVVGFNEFVSACIGLKFNLECNSTIVVDMAEICDLESILRIMKYVADESEYYETYNMSRDRTAQRCNLKVILIGNRNCKNYARGFNIMDVMLDDDFSSYEIKNEVSMKRSYLELLRATMKEISDAYPTNGDMQNMLEWLEINVMTAPSNSDGEFLDVMETDIQSLHRAAVSRERTEKINKLCNTGGFKVVWNSDFASCMDPPWDDVICELNGNVHLVCDEGRLVSEQIRGKEGNRKPSIKHL